MKLAMKVLGVFLLLLLGSIALSSYLFEKKRTALFSPQPPLNLAQNEYWSRPADIALGERMYQVRFGCVECHGRDLSGKKVMDNPAMGTFYAPNITPFYTKNLTDEQMIKAIRYGLHSTNRSLLFMPSFDYTRLDWADLKAIIAYLRSVPEVSLTRPQSTVGPLGKILSLAGKIPVMLPAYEISQVAPILGDRPKEESTVEFGEYLSHACVGCHGKELRGGKIEGGDPSWPATPSLRFGADSTWTRENFHEVMATGMTRGMDGKGKKPLAYPMPVDLMKEFNTVEKDALFLYFSSLK